ncbi:unnamed protein product [Spirodela intermedia]|uniref:Uncharacterized protein n=1 Tax=Spirodela intermedia TaxID=51605 RepID=A0A7I8LCI7_SPIIN|nr:unnamed protein product [Spirodela intermedia]
MLATSSRASLSGLLHHRLLPASPSPPRPPPLGWEEWGLERRRKGSPAVRLRAHAHGASPLQQQSEAYKTAVILCDPCKGRGWLLCDFCRGQKINVKSESNRIYRRCPSCKAAGYVLCPKCKVFKCVTFPDYGDGEM